MAYGRRKRRQPKRNPFPRTTLYAFTRRNKRGRAAKVTDKRIAKVAAKVVRKHEELHCFYPNGVIGGTENPTVTEVHAQVGHATSPALCAPTQGDQANQRNGTECIHTSTRLKYRISMPWQNQVSETPSGDGNAALNKIHVSQPSNTVTHLRFTIWSKKFGGKTTPDWDTFSPIDQSREGFTVLRDKVFKLDGRTGPAGYDGYFNLNFVKGGKKPGKKIEFEKTFLGMMEAIDYGATFFTITSDVPNVAANTRKPNVLWSAKSYFLP